MTGPRRPIIIGHHIIWTGYGWWLPNDPRGSTSRTVASDVIAELGQLHFGRKRIQPAGKVIRDFYERAKPVLKFDLLSFSQEQIDLIADALGQCVRTHRYTCYACAILPDHVHILIRRHKHEADEIMDHLQETSRLHLQKWAIPQHPVWSQGGWTVFLDAPDDIARTISYVNGNTQKFRMPHQDWPFVCRYDGWPHPPR